METLGQERQAILDAIREGDYTIYIDEPNNVVSRERRNGSRYLVIYDMDDAKSSTYFGESTLDVAGHIFRCDLYTGEWSCDMEDLLEDEDVISAVEGIEGLPCGCMTDLDAQATVYNLAHGTDYDEYFWYEDDECPMNPDFMNSLPDLEYPTVEHDGITYFLVDGDIHDADDDHRGCRWRYGAFGDPDDYGVFRCVALLFDDGGKVTGVMDTDAELSNEGELM